MVTIGLLSSPLSPPLFFSFSGEEKGSFDELTGTGFFTGDRLILGLSTGALRVYRVHSPDSPNVSLSLLRTVESFSRRKIELLACIKEAGILVSLADSNVHIHDLNDFSLTETLNKARGATALAVTSNVERDAETQIPSIVSKLAIGVRRKLLMYSWADGGFQEGKEVTLSGQVKSLTWANGHRIVVGLASGFVVVDVDTASVEEVVPSEGANGGGGSKARDEKAGWGSYVGMGGWGSRSLSTRIGGDELLLVRDCKKSIVRNFPNMFSVAKKRVRASNPSHSFNALYRHGWQAARKTACSVVHTA